GVSLFLVSSREESHASDLDGFSFRGGPESRLLPKRRRRSGRCSSHESRCNRFNSARGAVLRASYPVRGHQVLPGIRCGAPRLPPFPSLVVVKPRSSACQGKSRSDFPVAAAKSTG